MIERQILAQKLKEKEIEDFVFSHLGKLSCSHVKMQRTPLGEKIVVYTSRPGLIVGKKGANIRVITSILKTRFNMENPQIEVEEISNPATDAASVARTLISGFQRFGPKRFKAMAYRALDEALKAGASGIEVVIAGRGVPGERAKTWRFSAGYLKKSGDISANFMDRCYEGCDIKSGTIGIKVSILHSDVILPDKMKPRTATDVVKGAVKIEEKTEKVEEKSVVSELKEAKKSEKKEEAPKKERSKKAKEAFGTSENTSSPTKPRKKKTEGVKSEVKVEGKKTEEVKVEEVVENKKFSEPSNKSEEKTE